MKIVFIPAKTKVKLNKEAFLQEISVLPKTFAIAYSIQFKEHAREVKALLSKEHKVTSLVQVLGCSNPKFHAETKAILLMGSGKFHAVSLAFESGLPVYVWEHNKITKVTEAEVGALEKKKHAARAQFLHANTIGVVISNKPGQERLARALALREKFPEKIIYFFLENNVPINEFENFQIDCWVNTACPRMNFDYAVMNLTEAEKLAQN